MASEVLPRPEVRLTGKALASHWLPNDASYGLSRATAVKSAEMKCCSTGTALHVDGHISDNTGNDGSGDAEPFLPATALGPVLNAFEEWGLGDVLEHVGHGYQGVG